VVSAGGAGKEPAGWPWCEVRAGRQAGGRVRMRAGCVLYDCSSICLLGCFLLAQHLP